MQLKTLVVEDDANSLELICEALNASGIGALGTRSPQHACELVEGEKFDGIFLDLSMPGLDGLELSRRIRKSSHNATTPIVVVTNHTDPATVQEAFRAGAHFFLSKPLHR